MTPYLTLLSAHVCLLVVFAACSLIACRALWIWSYRHMWIEVCVQYVVQADLEPEQVLEYSPTRHFLYMLLDVGTWDFKRYIVNPAAHKIMVDFFSRPARLDDESSS